MTSVLSQICENENLGKIKTFSPVLGGDINQSYQIKTDQNIFFIKLNQNKDIDFFYQEAKNLEFLNKNGVSTPTVISYGQIKDYSYLILEYLSPCHPNSNNWTSFALQLVHLHKTHAKTSGWSSDNYIGSLIQVNTNHENWLDFFIQERLEPLIERGLNNELLDRNDLIDFRKLTTKLHDFVPEEANSLLHGDLWTGNVHFSNNHPYFVDPACYFGNREVDIAMMKLFSGFPEDVFVTYHELYPLKDGWEERLKLWNLYPLLVHLNLFGRIYLSQIRETLNSFVT